MFCWGVWRGGLQSHHLQAIESGRIEAASEGILTRYRAWGRYDSCAFLPFTQILQNIFCLKCHLNVFTHSFNMYRTLTMCQTLWQELGNPWGYGPYPPETHNLVGKAHKETCHWWISTQQGNKWHERTGEAGSCSVEHELWQQTASVHIPALPFSSCLI